MLTLDISRSEAEILRVGLKLLGIALAFPNRASRSFLAKAFDDPALEMARFDQRHAEVLALQRRLEALEADPRGA